MEHLLNAHFAILLGCSNNEPVMMKEIDDFFSLLLEIENGKYVSDPITVDEYDAIVSKGNEMTLYGDYNENIKYIEYATKRGETGTKEFMSFSELHRFSDRLKILL